MPLNTIRQVCLISLPFLLITAIIFHFFVTTKPWSEYFYIISLTANIGYFTNFIAIKMLFKPYQKTVLGRQGLIPKNQSKLASALSSTLNSHFLTSQHWQDYIKQTDITAKILSASQIYCEGWISKPENIEQLIKSLSESLQQNDSQLKILLQQLQSQVMEQMTSQLSFEDLLEKGSAWLEQQFETRPQEMTFMIEPVVKSIAENIPQIAQRLVATVDQQIENQGTIKRSIAKAARWSADFSEEDVKQYLFRMVASPEFRKTLFEGLRSLISEYKNSSSNSGWQQGFNFNQVAKQLVNAQTAAIDISQLISKTLHNPELIKLIQDSPRPLFNWLQSQLDRPDIKHCINQQIIQLIETIDLKQLIEEKARDFSPQQMEKLFKTMISDQLIFIELLGAVLGGLSGLALIDLRLFAGLAGGLVILYWLDHWLTIRRDNKTKREKQNVGVI